MKKKYYVGISLLVAFLIIVIDQVTKWIIASSMKIGDSYEVIPNFLNITSHRNNGAAWGILSGKMFFFYIITVIILIVLVLFFIKEAQYNLFMQLAISLLFAGALGNFIDRLFNGEVVDFEAMVRFDSLVELDYYRHGGILQMVLRNKLAQ